VIKKKGKSPMKEEVDEGLEDKEHDKHEEVTRPRVVELH